MPDYRLYFMDRRDHIHDVVVITCDTDAEAIARAEQHRDGRAMELWERARRVMAFAHSDPLGQGRPPARRGGVLGPVLGRIGKAPRAASQDRAPPERVLLQMLDAAIGLTGADRGNVQLLDPSTGALVIAAQRGFDPDFLAYFERVEDRTTACGAALALGGQVVVEDVTDSPVFSDPQTVGILLRSRVRAVCSTPLTSASGRTWGVISTHYDRPRAPRADELSALSRLVKRADGEAWSRAPARGAAGSSPQVG